MRSLTLCAAVAALLFTPVASHAADKGGPVPPASYAQPAPEPVVAYKGGAYIGLTAGYSSAVFETEGFDFGAQDPFVGVFGGYAFVHNGWVLGLEGDYMLTAIETVQNESGFTFKSGTDYLASLRGRVGVAWGPVMFYLTGGAAWTEQTISVPNDKDSKTLWGYVGGGGAEAELTRTITIRLEALQYHFEAEDFDVGGDSIEAQNDQTVVRGGLSFKLN